MILQMICTIFPKTSQEENRLLINYFNMLKPFGFLRLHQKMAKLIWTERAICSLESIHNYIAQDSIQYANYQTHKIIESLEPLTTFPESGKFIPEFCQSSYRQVIVGAYRIIYRFDRSKNIIYVINIVHGSRLLTDSYIVEPKD